MIQIKQFMTMQKPPSQRAATNTKFSLIQSVCVCGRNTCRRRSAFVCKTTRGRKCCIAQGIVLHDVRWQHTKAAHTEASGEFMLCGAINRTIGRSHDRWLCRCRYMGCGSFALLRAQRTTIGRCHTDVAINYLLHTYESM